MSLPNLSLDMCKTCESMFTARCKNCGKIPHTIVIEAHPNHCTLHYDGEPMHIDGNNINERVNNLINLVHFYVNTDIIVTTNSASHVYTEALKNDNIEFRTIP